MNSPKRGRPFLQDTERRKNRFEIRLTDDELALLEECAEKSQQTKTQVLIRGLELFKREL